MSIRTLAGALILALLLFTAKSSFAQTSIPSHNKLFSPGDSNWVGDYTNKLTARFFLLFQNASLIINAENIGTIIYRPNVNVRVGIAGFWKWFGLGLSIDNPFYKMDKDKYGKTSVIDLRVNAFGRKTAAELFLQSYKGFYISSTKNSNNEFYTIPDMVTFSMGAAGYWIYNSNRFSIRAAFIQNERQKKSAGSFVIRPSFTYYNISSDAGIIPDEIINEYNIPSANHINRGDFYSIGLSPGYAYTFVFLKNLYITAAIFPGVAVQFFSYTTEQNRYSNYEFSFQLDGRFALGYNSDKWFLGGSVQTGFNEVPDKLSNSMFDYDVSQFRVWGGTRFDIFRKKKK
ncbi:MAG: DUF4421 family protein [Bacteroidales bacterium]|nr:DUF4421 domain-containing protein [Bacteroidales bacterium]MDD4602301.1 DUF4421 family protein [Bacteroidales bacterium]